MVYDLVRAKAGDIICWAKSWGPTATNIQRAQAALAVIKAPLTVALAVPSVLTSIATQQRYNYVNTTLHTSKIHHIGILLSGGIDGKLAHAIDGVIKVQTTQILFKLETKVTGVRVFRCTDDAVAKGAADVATNWSTNPTGKFSGVGSVAAAFRPSFYGPLAALAAARYHEHRAKLGGPPGWVAGSTDMFCAEFVIACYQAQLGAINSIKYMAKDATNTLPATLASYLESNGNWQDVTKPSPSAKVMPVQV
jgi:hypothetical protein